MRQANLEHSRPFTWPLLGYGLASIGLYVWLALTYPLLPGLERGRANWATLGERSLAAGLWHGAVYTFLLVLYLLALRAALRQPLSALGPRPSALIWGVWLATVVVLSGSFPGESLDVFDYLFRGRMLAEYGASPLAVAPSTFADRPFYRFITWRGQVDTYGPLWEYASGSVARVVGQFLAQPLTETSSALATYVTGYRLLAVLVSGLCGVLVERIVRRRAPALAPAALLAWLWNPLLLTASAVGAHNDVLLALWVLVALWLLQRRRWSSGLLVLLLAAHVKLTALLLLPVVGVWLIRRIGWGRAWASSMVAIAVALPVSWLLYAPLGGWATLPRMLTERMRFLANAPADLLYRWLQAQAGWAEPDARRLATAGATLLFVLVAAVVIAVMLDARAACCPAIRGANALDDDALWRTGLAVTMIYLLIGSFWLMPWYGLWALPLAALMPERDAMRFWMPALTLGALWSGLTADVLTFLKPPRLTAAEVTLASVTLFMAPLAVIVCVVLLRASRRNRAAHDSLVPEATGDQ